MPTGNLNSPAAFVRWVLALGKILSEGVHPIEQRHLTAAIAMTREGDWHDMTTREVDKLYAQLAKEIEAIGPPAAEVVVTRLEAPAAELLDSVRRNLARTLQADVAAALPATRAATYDFLRTSQSLWVTDQYKTRSLTGTRLARGVVEEGLKEGLTNKQIAKQLAEKLKDVVVGRSEAYYDTVATTFANRSRTYASLSTYDELDVRRYRWVAQVDQHTCTACRFLHGKTSRVDAGLRRLTSIQQMKDPQSQVPKTLPWIRHRIVKEGEEEYSYGGGRMTKLRVGERVMYIDRPGGKRLLVARVDEVGTGTDTGRYSRKMPVGTLEDVGLTVPPSHSRCRCRVEPVS